MVVHLRATGDAPILKQAKFKVSDFLLYLTVILWFSIFSIFFLNLDF